MTLNHQWQLAHRPSGEASPDNFAWVSAPIPSLLEGQVLVRHHFLSLDPYMRGRMNDSKSYVCLLYTSPSPRDRQKSRMPSSA